MGDGFKVDLSTLEQADRSLKSIKGRIENVVDAIPTIKRMSAEAWNQSDDVGGQFEQNCVALRNNCIKVMHDVDVHSQMLDKVIKVYPSKETENKSTVQKLSAENIF